LRDPIRVPRIENRVPGIRETYHRVPIIDIRVPTSPYRVPNTFLEKNAARKQKLKNEFSNLNSRTTETSSSKITAQQICAMKDNYFHCW